MNSNILFEKVYVIVTVDDDDVFACASELHNIGLNIDTCLPLTHVVMGWCSKAIVEKLSELSFVTNIEEDESRT